MMYHPFLRNERVDHHRDPASSPTVLVAIPFFILGMIFSHWYLESYYAGDAVHYNLFYDFLYDMPSEHWTTFQRNYVGSTEPLYRYVLAAGAYFGVERNFYLSAWNGVFFGAIGYVLVKYRCSILFCFFVFTNYYLFVLLGPAERLKFAYIALVLAFAVEDRKAKAALAASSPFFHTQAMVQFASGLGYYIAANVHIFAKTPLRAITVGIGGTIGIGAVFYFFFVTMGQTIEAKSEFYIAESGGLLEAIQWGLLLIVGLAVFRDRFAFFISMVPMGVLTVLFGNRVNVATFAMFAALAIMQRKTNNPVVLAVMAYMSFKSIAFLSDVAKYGTGYP